jgi:SAM-dependent methyltransferase
MSFGAIAGDYDRLRPPPPPEAVEWLLPARRDVVVDLGAGTGLLARAVASVAGHVIAVDPDDRMRSVLADRSPGVEVLAGRGEAIPLPDASADAVVVSSAWHWMDPDRAVPEIARVLRDDGRFGVIWTGREQTPWLRPDDWFAVGDRDLAAPQGAERTTSERLLAVPDPDTFHKIETATFRFRRSMTIPDLVEWLTTYSRSSLPATTSRRPAGPWRRLRFASSSPVLPTSRCRCAPAAGAPTACLDLAHEKVHAVRLAIAMSWVTNMMLVSEPVRHRQCRRVSGLDSHPGI